MAKRNFKYNNTVDLSNIPRKGSNKIYDWVNSIGCIVPFTFDDGKLIGEFKIIDYKTPNGLTNKHIYFEYLGNKLKPILPSSVTNAKLNVILDEYYIEWKFKIGQHLTDGDRDIIITDRFRKKDKSGILLKSYKIMCNKCGFNSNEHYTLNQEKRNEWMVSENDLFRQDSRKVNCPCCNSKIVVVGINDIPTTAPWMVNYFQGGYNEAKMYLKTSNVKKYFKCIYCGEIKKIETSIRNLYYMKELSCVCRDTISYPNRFAYFLFKELESQYDNYINEYSPAWADRYRYDNYIEQNDKKIIFEFDGKLGHGNRQFHSDKIDVEGKSRDIIKNNLAQQNGIILERIDCVESTYEYMVPNIIKTLSKYFDLSKVDFIEIEKKCRTVNFYKKICEYYENTHKTVNEIKNDLNFSTHKIYDALRIGNKVGWCKFKFKSEKSLETDYAIIDYWNSHDCRTRDVANELKVSQSKVVNILKEANKKNLCVYDPVKETNDNYMERGSKIYVYNKNFQLLKIYNNISDCITNCVSDFGTQFCSRSISYVCSKKSKTHKGFVFSRKEITEKYNLEKNTKKCKVNVYSMDMIYLKTYNSYLEASQKSLGDFGIQFNVCNINLVCNNKARQHKGYIFRKEKNSD